MNKVILEGTIDTIGIKSFHIVTPEVIMLRCPKCKKESELDYQNFHCLSYPEQDKAIKDYMYCCGCDKDYIVKIKLSVAVKLEITSEFDICKKKRDEKE